MINKFKPISISLSPNVEPDDIMLALKLLFQPWKWKNGKTIKEFEESFAKYLGVKYAFSFNSGRSSLFAILKSIDLQENSDILLQSFTCNAVPNPILWANLNPVYVDCGEDFNIDIKDLKNKITENSKVLIVQHTFGLPANMDEIIKFAKENNLIVIEDCAHALGAHFHTPEYESEKVGTVGKAAFFSFSRDKVISSVYGGMAVTNDPEISEKIRQAQDEFGMPSYFWIFQQIVHPILLNIIILPIYNFLDLGKLFLIFSQWLHILSKAVSSREKRGLKPDYFPKSLPNAMALMALNQFRKLDKFNEHRKKIAEFYYNNLIGTKFILPKKDGNIFLRFAIQHKQAHEIIYESWHKKNMLLGDWYTTPIAPDDTNLKDMKYQLGMCKTAEKLSRVTLNLPTHINIKLEDAGRIVIFFKKYA